MADYSDFIRNNIAPYAAKKIGVYNSSGTRVGSISLGDFKPSYGERLYRFGFLSDVHNETDQADENSDDLINALTYLNEKESVEFICISGDLTQTSYSTNDLSTEMALYQLNLNSANIGKTVYVTTGNHDCPNSSDVDITTFYQYAGLSDIAPASGAEYSYEVTKTHTTSSGTTVTDHFLFLTMKRYEFTSNTYSTTDITWLKNKLETYKNDRCFVITHMFFPTYAGNLNDIYPSGNWLSGTMLTQVKALIDAYPRSIWFSGHSHWKWYLQKYQDRANVYPITNETRTTGWAVHMPSCASPIDSDGTTRVSQSTQSEGAIIDVYENYIDIRGIEFKGASDSDYAQRYIPIALYRLYTEPGVTSSDDSDSSETTTHKNTIVAKLDAVSSGLGFSSGQSSVTTGYYIKYDAIKITTADGTDITTDITSTGKSDSNSYKVGCYAYPNDDTTQSAGIYEYAEAGTYFMSWLNSNLVNNAYTIPVIQASSSSAVATTNLYVQLTGIKYSTTPDDIESWIEINSGTTVINGSSWGKTDVSFTWVDSIVDDPTTLTLATTYTES